MKKRILCYGDSNTWGFVPATGDRFDDDIRWTGRLQKLLGTEYQVIECGMNARTTVFDDFYKDYLNGRKGLPYCLVSQKQIDLLIFSLGTNDLKYATAIGSSKGLDELLRIATNANQLFDGVFRDRAKVLVISPIALQSNLDEVSPTSALVGKYPESLHFAEHFRPVCEKYGVEFLNAAEYAEASRADGIHMDAENHGKLAAVIAAKVQQIV